MSKDSPKIRPCLEIPSSRGKQPEGNSRWDSLKTWIKGEIRRWSDIPPGTFKQESMYCVITGNIPSEMEKMESEKHE